VRNPGGVSRSTVLAEVTEAPDVILVGGVPGAGKTTAIRRATADLVGVIVLDPEDRQRTIEQWLPLPLPYRAYRWLIHLLHTVDVLVRLLRGPVVGQRLVVHDPGTRRRRRRLFVTLARARGWRTTLLFLDVNHDAARSGQRVRGRVLRRSAFERHWSRWQQLRSGLVGTGIEDHRPVDPEQDVVLVHRDDAARVLRLFCLGLPYAALLTRTALHPAA
jgi:predicted ABC-type ATPase